MYLAIDVGGTKTLLAVFDENGQIVAEHKFDTNPDYPSFLNDLKAEIAHINHHNFSHCCVALPALIDRKNGIGTEFGNLEWHNVPAVSDVSQILHGIPVYVENDANLAGLSEALEVINTYNKVLYLTVSTGIGDGIIVNGAIDPVLSDSEPGSMLIEHEGQLKKWESFASGKALKEKWGKLAADIDDPDIWLQFAKDLSLGLIELMAIVQPEVVIIGGSLGTHFNKYGKILNEQIANISNHMIMVPPVIQAKRPEEAVVYGCYQFIKQKVS